MSSQGSSRSEVRAVIGDRATGKTFNAVEWLMEEPLCSGRFLAVMNRRERQRLIDLYEITEARQARIITWDQMEAERGYKGPIFIDNAVMYLTRIIHRYGFGLGGWSATGGAGMIILDGKKGD